MNIASIISELKVERKHIDDAIAALEGLSSNGTARAKAAKPAAAAGTRRSRLSPEARKRLSETMKKRWAERRKKAAAKK